MNLSYFIDFNTIRVQFLKVPGNYAELVKNMNKKPDIQLYPFIASQYLQYSKQNSKIGFGYHYSKCIDFLEVAQIAARYYPGTLPLVTYFRCFPIEVWALIWISIIVLSLISTQQTLKLIDFYEFLWNYSNILFNKTFQKFITHLKYKYFVGIWLLSALILSIEFTVYLLDFMVLTQPVVKIDSLEQLSKMSAMKILTRADSSLVKFASLTDSDLARAIFKQLEPYQDKDYKNTVVKLARGLRDGSVAYVNNKLTLIFELLKLNEFQIKANEEPLIDLVHISEDDGGLEPYFVLFNAESDEWISNEINKM